MKRYRDGVENRLLIDSIGLLYDSLISAERWNDFLTQLCFQLNCASASIAVHDLDNQSPAVKLSKGLSEQLIEEWNARYGRTNPRGQEIRRAVVQNGFWLGNNSLSKAPAAYQDDSYMHWLRTNDLYHSLVLAVRSGSTVTSLNLTRPESTCPFGPAAQTLMQRLVPHIERVLQINSANETLRTLFEAEKFILDKIDAAVIAVDQQQHVVLANRSADAILSASRGLVIRGGKLSAKDISDAIELEGLLRSATQTSIGRSESNGGVMMIHDDKQPAPISVIVTPFRSSCVLADERPCALVFIVDQATKPRSRARLLRDLFRLSPAECRLAELLQQGLDVDAVADHLRVTTETARFMLKRIFRKTGLHRQSHLLQLLSRLPSE